MAVGVGVYTCAHRENGRVVHRRALVHFLHMGGVLRDSPCTHGYNGPIEEVTLHMDMCPRVCCMAEGFSTQRKCVDTQLVYAGDVQQEWCFACVEERRYRRADPALGL